MTEYWDLYNAARQRTGKIIRRGDAIPVGLYHLSASAWIRNSRGDYLLSQRHPHKSYPLRWECTGGCIRAGEDSLSGILRELYEELGLRFSPENATLLYQTRRETTQDFYDVWLFHSDAPLSSLTLQASEVVDARWCDRATLETWFHTGKLHPLIDRLDMLP